MKKKILIILFAVSSFAFSSQAQVYSRNMFVVAWEIGLPVSNNDFLSKTSFSGGKVEYRHLIKDNLSIGGFFNWRSYYEYFPTATYENEDKTQAVTTDMYRYIYNLPMGATVHYYFKGGDMIKPFAGLGLGAQYSEQSMYYNIFVSEDKNWGFLVRPEVGAIIKFQDQWGALIGASYAYSTNKNPSLGIKNLGDVNFQIGLVFSE
jgi:outer membrane protein W